MRPWLKLLGASFSNALEEIAAAWGFKDQLEKIRDTTTTIKDMPSDTLERYLEENFEVKSKNSSEETLQKWRDLCSVVKNPKRRFRHTANLSKREEAANLSERTLSISIAVLVSKAAFHYIGGGLGEEKAQIWEQVLYSPEAPFEEIAAAWGFKDQLEKIRDTTTTIKDMPSDAERKQVEDSSLSLGSGRTRQTISYEGAAASAQQTRIPNDLVTSPMVPADHSFQLELMPQDEAWSLAATAGQTQVPNDRVTSPMMSKSIVVYLIVSLIWIVLAWLDYKLIHLNLRRI